LIGPEIPIKTLRKLEDFVRLSLKLAIFHDFSINFQDFSLRLFHEFFPNLMKFHKSSENLKIFSITYTMVLSGHDKIIYSINSPGMPGCFGLAATLFPQDAPSNLYS